ncbi:MAG: hypothetical protein QM698_06130 [Micropepsaceae bacterium]
MRASSGRRILDRDAVDLARARRQQHAGRDLHEAHAPAAHRDEVEIQRCHVIHREREAQLRQFREARLLARPHRVIGALRQLEDDLVDEVAMRPHEIDELGKELRVVQRGERDIAEDADIALAGGEAADELHRTEQQQIVDRRHQPRLFGDGQILRRHDGAPVGGAQTRQRFVEFQLALRQADDRLHMQIDAVVDQRALDDIQHFRFRRGGDGLRRGLTRRGGGGRAHLRQALLDLPHLGRGFGLRRLHALHPLHHALGELTHQRLEDLYFAAQLRGLIRGAGLQPLDLVLVLLRPLRQQIGEDQIGALQRQHLPAQRRPVGGAHEHVLQVRSDHEHRDAEHARQSRRLADAHHRQCGSRAGSGAGDGDQAILQVRHSVSRQIARISGGRHKLPMDG